MTMSAMGKQQGKQHKHAVGDTLYAPVYQDWPAIKTRLEPLIVQYPLQEQELLMTQSTVSPTSCFPLLAI